MATLPYRRHEEQAKMDSTADVASRRGLRYQINHLFLPPKTPQKDDINPTLENELVASVLRCLRAFGEALSDARPPAVDVCLGMLQRMLSVRAPGTRLDPEQLEKEFRQLRDAGTCSVLCPNCYPGR